MQIFADLFQRYGFDLLSGTWLTVQLVAISAVLGLCLAIPVALARLSENRLVAGLASGYSLFFRGTPLLVQIFLVYYGLGQFDFVRSSFLWPVLREAYVCALITFVLNTAAYSGEIVRGGILAVPKGEIEAARACGMAMAKTYRLVILPRAFSICLPAYSNEVIILMKGTSLASTITLLELTGVARLAASATYQPIQVFVIAGVIYYLLTLLISWIFRLLEARYNRYITQAR
ncbi:ABC transporter permease [Mangrovicoccus ximenensis]|uniref:ABC transporter permease n=1 Tax=Mangrovicoccus ximenensis TaxID=1911570 RepID=UPI000D38FF6A|nr:ABC transporter permease [Mangrovicoccus ximenensis]